jgi:transcriptional antiterminator
MEPLLLNQVAEATSISQNKVQTVLNKGTAILQKANHSACHKKKKRLRKKTKSEVEKF